MVRDKVMVRVYILRFKFYALYPQPNNCKYQILINPGIYST